MTQKQPPETTEERLFHGCLDGCLGCTWMFGIGFLFFFGFMLLFIPVEGSPFVGTTMILGGSGFLSYLWKRKQATPCIPAPKVVAYEPRA